MKRKIKIYREFLPIAIIFCVIITGIIIGGVLRVFGVVNDTIMIYIMFGSVAILPAIAALGGAFIVITGLIRGVFYSDWSD